MLHHGYGRWFVRTLREYTYIVELHRHLLATPSPDEILLDRDVPACRLVIVDANVHKLYGERIRAMLDRMAGRAVLTPLAAAETTKDRTLLDQIHAAALACGLGRRDELIAVGGGTILDLVGTAAAELRKGTSYVAVPTTLVGLIDAGFAAKRAVNAFGRKNLLGAYWPPRRVILDPTFLASLDQRQISAGMAEVKKIAEMIDPDLFRLLEQHGSQLVSNRFAHSAADDVIGRTLHGILSHLAEDLFERNLCRWPDYGHTISPVLELRAALLHGEAVAICSALSAVLAFNRDYVTPGDLNRMLRLSRALALPLWHPLLADRRFLDEALTATVLHRGGHQHWPVPAGIGQHRFVEDASIAEIAHAAKNLRTLASQA